MKPLGIIRRCDELGRIVIPVELARTLGWISDTQKRSSVNLEMFATDQGIFLRKYDPSGSVPTDTTIDSVEM